MSLPSFVNFLDCGASSGVVYKLFILVFSPPLSHSASTPAAPLRPPAFLHLDVGTRPRAPRPCHRPARPPSFVSSRGLVFSYFPPFRRLLFAAFPPSPPPPPPPPPLPRATDRPSPGPSGRPARPLGRLYPWAIRRGSPSRPLTPRRLPWPAPRCRFPTPPVPRVPPALSPPGQPPSAPAPLAPSLSASRRAGAGAGGAALPFPAARRPSRRSSSSDAGAGRPRSLPLSERPFLPPFPPPAGPDAGSLAAWLPLPRAFLRSRRRCGRQPAGEHGRTASAASEGTRGSDRRARRRFRPCAASPRPARRGPRAPGRPAGRAP